jgi:hypothetical protein
VLVFHHVMPLVTLLGSLPEIVTTAADDLCAPNTNAAAMQPLRNDVDLIFMYVWSVLFRDLPFFRQPC